MLTLHLKGFRSDHRYISNLYALDGGRVLEMVEERTESACNALIEQALTPQQQINVTGVALDRWKTYANAVTKKLPQAVIVHDKFHISRRLRRASYIFRLLP